MISKESLSTWIMGVVAQTLAVIFGSSLLGQLTIVCVTGIFGILASAISTYLKFYLTTKQNHQQIEKSAGDKFKNIDKEV